MHHVHDVASVNDCIVDVVKIDFEVVRDFEQEDIDQLYHY